MKPYRLLYDPTQCALYSSCILSAGLDTKATLWAVPEPDKLDEHMGTDKPAMVHYPHFSTMEVYTDFVDCIQWYNDLIFSHACREGKIILWKIDGGLKLYTLLYDPAGVPDSTHRL